MKKQDDKKQQKKQRRRRVIINYEIFLKKLRERELWNTDIPFL